MPRKRKKDNPISFLLVFIILVVLVVGGIFFWVTADSRPVSNSQEKVNFIIKTGDTVDPIGKKLKEVGLIRSTAVFKLIVMKEGIATKIQAGSFSLSPSMSASEIAKSLTTGRQDFWITILPGSRKEEVVEQLYNDFKKVGLTFDKDVFLLETKDKEGMLFPETHLLPLYTTEETVASVILNTFNSRVNKVYLSEINSQGKSLSQILTLASIIEREANDKTSMKMVAGILYNRLELGMALQVDATLQYIKGYSSIHKDWWAPPLAQDKSIDSPYNTYKYSGLPPGPICSPSINSIEAAIYPTSNNYLYYITDNNGNMHYAQTFEDHNQNVNTYLR